MENYIVLYMYFDIVNYIREKCLYGIFLYPKIDIVKNADFYFVSDCVCCNFAL